MLNKVTISSKKYQGQLRKKKPVEQVWEEQEEERIRLQSAQYYELNKPTRDWTLNSHLLDTDYNDDDDYGT